MHSLSRRCILAGAAVLLPALEASAQAPAAQKLTFEVYRNGAKIGRHAMTFSGAPGEETVRTDVEMLVRLGPVPVYRYRHSAEERWSRGRFASLQTTTNGNGRIIKVMARRTAGGVMIDGPAGRVSAPPQAAPLTHWNRAVLPGPLFNPQEGKLLSLIARRGAVEAVVLADGRTISAQRWSLRGEHQIDNWYDEGGAWAALKGRLEDGSQIEYRRL